jgi:hypothetical protein
MLQVKKVEYIVDNDMIGQKSSDQYDSDCITSIFNEAVSCKNQFESARLYIFCLTQTTLKEDMEF